jgi:hypothetical protein
MFQVSKEGYSGGIDRLPENSGRQDRDWGWEWAKKQYAGKMDKPILLVKKKRNADMKMMNLHKHFYIGRDCLIYFFIVLICLFSFQGYGEGATLFSSQSFMVEGRMLSLIPTDLDGKGFAEIVVAHKTGIYPNEKRWISVFSADTLAHYATTPCQRWEVDPAATLFDVGDIAPSPGKEIFYLTGRGIRYYHQVADNCLRTGNSMVEKCCFCLNLTP